MSATLELPQKLRGNVTPHPTAELDISSVVKAATRVIAPLWPIDTFAARNPWVGLEGHPFDQVARWLKDTCHVDMYPGVSMIQVARSRGEIDEAILEAQLGRWLDSQSLDVPRRDAERFCRAALTEDDPPASLLEAPELKNVEAKLEGLVPQDDKKHACVPMSRRVDEQFSEGVVRTLDHHVIKWCKLFLDKSQAAWSLPHREEGFYRAWRRLIEHDPALRHEHRRRLKGWPQEASTALTEALSLLGIPTSAIQDYLEAHLLSLPGWAGMMLWRSQHSARESSLVTEYLAVRISLEWAMCKPHLPLPQTNNGTKQSLAPFIAAWAQWGDLPIKGWTLLPHAEQKSRLLLADRFDEMTRRRLWLEAWEQTYANQLRNKIESKQTLLDEGKRPTQAQFVFCLDVRSEPFRRHLENAGPFETYGMAGFFGLPIEKHELGSEQTHASLPVILKPEHHVKETSSGAATSHYHQRRLAANSLSFTFKMLKRNLLASLLLPEVSGPWLGLQMLARSFVPRGAGRAFRRFRAAWLRKPSTDLSLDKTHIPKTGVSVGFSDQEKVHYARQALTTMGLTEHFAPLVVICGHRSQSTNNPYAAALHCGACGGSAGGFNARVLATLCNLPKVREKLAAEGISIPADTIFVAAEHITSLDALNWLYVPDLSEKAQQAFDRIQGALESVSHDANAERLSHLPNLDEGCRHPSAEARRFAEDWSEVRPEWGLAGNAALIIGRRELTKELNLGGRAFLQNYDWKSDKDGSLLKSVIAGPGTVCQWINLQYYASTVAPHFYGSGNKATQTVTAGLGVMQGNASDLLAGLPWQSVMQSDREVFHAPLRLLVVIEAPKEYVERLLESDPAFRTKVQNGWLRLATIDPEGAWEDWSGLGAGSQPADRRRRPIHLV